MTFMKRLLVAVLLLVSIALPVSVNAQSSAAQVLAATDENGRITRLDFKTNELVVDDSLFKLAAGVAVYDRRGLRTTTRPLAKGVRIAFNVVRDSRGSVHISEVWVLPKK